jgi:hypothetical protein
MWMHANQLKAYIGYLWFICASTTVTKIKGSVLHITFLTNGLENAESKRSQTIRKPDRMVVQQISQIFELQSGSAERKLSIDYRID